MNLHYMAKFPHLSVLVSSGQKVFTLSLLNALKMAKVTSPTYNQQLDNALLRHRRNPKFPFRNPVMFRVRSNERSDAPQSSPNSQFQMKANIPTNNRFDILSRLPGNF